MTPEPEPPVRPAATLIVTTESAAFAATAVTTSELSGLETVIVWFDPPFPEGCAAWVAKASEAMPAPAPPPSRPATIAAAMTGTASERGRVAAGASRPDEGALGGAGAEGGGGGAGVDDAGATGGANTGGGGTGLGAPGVIGVSGWSGIGVLLSRSRQRASPS